MNNRQLKKTTMKLIGFIFVLYIFAMFCLNCQVNTQHNSTGSAGTNNITKVYYNSNEPPKPGQKSLLIVFDGTLSMTKDLEQLRIAAREIINDFSNRKDNSIYNYVLVVFRDPDIEDAINTRNPNDIMILLDQLVLDSSKNTDCPEPAVSGLNKALKYALRYSYAYVFTDATAKDYHLANITEQLIQSTQTTVNFLTTDSCNEPSHIRYKIYGEIAGKNGQVFNVPRNELSRVVSNMKVQLDQKFSSMNSINVGKAGKIKIPFFVDSTMSDVRISLSGSSPKMIIQDPNSEYVTVKDLVLSNLEFVHIENPLPGKWQLTATSASDFSVRMGAISTVRFDFGFSLERPSKASETLFQPLKGQKNILSIFVSNPELLKSLTSVTIISNEDKGISSRKRREARENTLELTKISDNIYVTQAFEFPDELFSILLDGTDISGNQMERLISSSVRAITPSMNLILRFR